NSRMRVAPVRPLPHANENNIFVESGESSVVEVLLHVSSASALFMDWKNSKCRARRRTGFGVLAHRLALCQRQWCAPTPFAGTVMNFLPGRLFLFDDIAPLGDNFH